MGSSDHDDLAALDFSADRGHESDDVAKSDALDFSVADDGNGSAIDALDEYAPAEDTGGGLEAIDSLTEDTDDETEEDALAPFTYAVTNPAGTVSVSALIDGRIREVDLSPKVTSMSEAELADEILALADLARQKGLAGQHTYLLENDFLSERMRELGLDGTESLREFVELGMHLPTPEQAESAQAEVFATRYADGRG